jgi:hypothetical protein
MPVEWL